MNIKVSMLGVILCCAMAAVAPSYADDGGKGLAIAKERKLRDEGWKDSDAKTTMVLRNSQGEENTREIRTLNLEVANDGDKGLTIFDEPKDVRGTAFLNHSHTGAPDDQWLYLPSVKRVKRIASRNKSGPFMGSEFAYEDLSSFELEKFKFQWLRDEWEINVVSTGQNNSIEYVECDDQTLTMLMIKYPKAFTHVGFVNQE